MAVIVILFSREKKTKKFSEQVFAAANGNTQMTGDSATTHFGMRLTRKKERKKNLNWEWEWTFMRFAKTKQKSFYTIPDTFIVLFF